MATLATITATMADGTTLVERVQSFEDFTAIVLGFRRDGECVRLTWATTPPPPEPEPGCGATLPPPRPVETAFLRVPADAQYLRAFVALAGRDLADAGGWLARWPAMRADVALAVEQARVLLGAEGAR